MRITPPFDTELRGLIETQRRAFLQDGIPDAATRQRRLNALSDLLTGNADRIAAAISADFGHRSRQETQFEIFGAVASLRAAAAQVADWMMPVLHQAPAPDAEARVEYTPLGVVGVIGPWNFPIVPIFAPLAGILAAGNRAIIKPSEYTPRTAQLLADLVAERFDPSEIAFVQGGAEEGALFAAAPFDHIIFTGSDRVARKILKAAADNLTPVTLELGGKSPVIVTEDFDLEEAAARIMAVKTRNAGQVCLAPDYVFVPEGREHGFADACARAVTAMFPDGLLSPDYSSIISDKEYRRLVRMLEDARDQGATIRRLLDGSNARQRRLAPTLLLDVRGSMMALQEEIFGPILPIVGYSDLEHVFHAIRAGGSPLALYYFGKDDDAARRALDATASGGVTINDVMAHMFVESMPFGGVGGSGTGAYRGKAGFETFSHKRSIYRQTAYQPAVELFRAPYGEAFASFVESAMAAEAA